jgi:hypothetical protein
VGVRYSHSYSFVFHKLYEVSNFSCRFFYSIFWSFCDEIWTKKSQHVFLCTFCEYLQWKISTRLW